MDQEPTTLASLRFDPYTGDISRGSFTLDPHDLRAAFAGVGQGGLPFGCTRLDQGGKVANIRFVDSERSAIERAFAEFGSGNAELSDFRKLSGQGTGFTLNSLQDPRKPGAFGFNKLAASFLDNLGQAPNSCAEEIDVVTFFGTYDAGFGWHKDAYDTAMFVLDGRKHFLIEVDGVQQKHTLKAGEYLRWTSCYAHSNWNPTGDWSLTLNFTLGPDASKRTLAGTPVDYRHAKTKLKNLLSAGFASVSRKL